MLGREIRLGRDYVRDPGPVTGSGPKARRGGARDLGTGP